MNIDQLQNWLTELNIQWKNENIKIEFWQKELTLIISNTQILNIYLMCNCEDVSLSQPIIAQLLALYYRLGYFFVFELN